MAKKVFDLYGTVGLQGLDKVKSGLSGLDQKAADSGKAMGGFGSALSSLSSPIALATGSLAGLAISLGKLTLDAAEWADNLLDSSDMLGLSTTAMQKWRGVIIGTGGNFESFTDQMQRLLPLLEEAATGNGQAADTFRRLGISVTDSTGAIRSMDDLLPEIFSALSNVASVTERATLAKSLFGKSLREIMPLLSMGSDELQKYYDKQNNLLSDEELENLDSFKTSWSEIGESIATAGRHLAAFIAKSSNLGGEQGSKARAENEDKLLRLVKPEFRGDVEKTLAEQRRASAPQLTTTSAADVTFTTGTKIKGSATAPDFGELEKLSDKQLEAKAKNVEEEIKLQEEASAWMAANDAKLTHDRITNAERDLEKEKNIQTISADNTIDGLEWMRQASIKYDEDDKKLIESKNQLQLEMMQSVQDKDAELNDEMTRRAQDTANAQRDAWSQMLSAVTAFFDTMQSFYDVQIDNIENQKQKELDRIDTLEVSEQEREELRTAAVKKADEKEREIKRKAAIWGKISGIANIAISTAQGIMEAWKTAMALPPPAVAAYGGAMTALLLVLAGIQTGIVSAQPIPAAQGAFVSSVPGGRQFTVGEGNDDEIIMPMQTGIDRIAAGLQRKMGSGINLNIGTLVADDRGIAELERRLSVERTYIARRNGAWA